MTEVITSMDLFIDRMEFEIANFDGENIFELYEILKKHARDCKSDFEEYEQMIKIISERLGI